METNIQRICNTNRHQGWFSCFMEKYEETVNNRDRAMTFGRLWEKFLASAYYSDLSPRTQKDYLQHQKKLLAVFGKVPADSIKPEHIRRYMDKRGTE